MKKILFLLIIIITNSCKNEKIEIYTINGNITGIHSNFSVKLDSIDSDNKKFKIDSVRVINNTFNFNIPKSKKATHYEIKIINDSLKQPVSFFRFWFENENISIKGGLSEEMNIKIKGGKLNEIQNGFNAVFIKYDTPEIRNEIMSSNSDEKRKNIIKKYMNLINNDRINFCFNNPDNIISLNTINDLSYYISSDSLKLYYNKLDKQLQSSSDGKQLERVMDIQKLKKGDTIQYFTAKDVNGKIVNLKKFFGNVILLDFWASWCAPCHKQNKEEFQIIFDKFKGKNFKIISYSIDKKSDEKAWIQSSKNDNIRWLNISNLEGSDDLISNQFQVSSYPTSFLINTKGMIEKVFIGYNPNSNEIEKEIEKLLK